jgi:hypothetical protein
MLRIALTMLFVLSSAAGHCGTDISSSGVRTSGLHIADNDTMDEIQAFDVYDEITESIFESYRLYHPHECRDFYVRKHRSDGKVYVDKLRRCD